MSPNLDSGVVHTPGPWTARPNNWSRWEIHYANGILASVSKWDDPATPPPIAEMKANASLIAAAPDLLTACEVALNDRMFKDWPEVATLLKDAIKKARGE